MAADDIAVLRAGHRPDDRTTLACRRRPPMNREPRLGSGWMGGETDMIGAIGTCRHGEPRKADGPPLQTGLLDIDSCKRAAPLFVRGTDRKRKYIAIIGLETMRH